MQKTAYVVSLGWGRYIGPRRFNQTTKTYEDYPVVKAKAAKVFSRFGHAANVAKKVGGKVLITTITIEIEDDQ